MVKKTILNRVSGSCGPGELVAILGARFVLRDMPFVVWCDLLSLLWQLVLGRGGLVVACAWCWGCV